jgi:hypothetical protein
MLGLLTAGNGNFLISSNYGSTFTNITIAGLSSSGSNYNMDPTGQYHFVTDSGNNLYYSSTYGQSFRSLPSNISNFGYNFLKSYFPANLFFL